MKSLRRLLKRRRELRTQIFNRRPELPVNVWRFPDNTWMRKRMKELRSLEKGATGR